MFIMVRKKQKHTVSMDDRHLLSIPMDTEFVMFKICYPVDIGILQTSSPVCACANLSVI